MKKLLLIFAGCLFISLSGHSQCTPDLNITQEGIHPDSATNLPHAIVGIPYSTVMQIRVPADTVAALTLDYDSVVVTNFSGLPPGYSKACNPSSCTFLGNSNGCVLISGPAPPGSWTGMTYPLSVTAVAYTHIHGTSIQYPPQTQQVNYYHIIVDANVGIDNISSVRFDATQNTPNPFSRTTTIEVAAPNAGKVTLNVSNILGKVVYTKTMDAERGINKFVLSAKEFEAGVYMYTVSDGNAAVTRRMIIQNE